MTVDLDGLEQTVRDTCALLDELRAQRDESRRHRDELVQLVSEALEFFEADSSDLNLDDWITSAKAAIASTAVQS